MAVLEMLPEVVRAEEFLGLVALAEFVDGVEVLGAEVPVGTVGEVGEFFAAVAADVCGGRGSRCR